MWNTEYRRTIISKKKLLILPHCTAIAPDSTRLRRCFPTRTPNSYRIALSLLHFRLPKTLSNCWFEGEREMGLLSNRVERAAIKAGDHIYTWRTAYTYSHHGIYVGGNKVVHFTRKPETPTDEDFPACSIFPDCGFRQPDSGVVLTCLDCFLDNGALYCFEYGAPSSVFLAKFRGGTCTTAISEEPEMAIHRAMYLLQHGFGNYNVFRNNCEDFALYCKTGLLTLDKTGPGGSGQASSFINIPVSAILSSPFNLLMAGPVGMATVSAGMYCAGRYMTDIGVRKDVIKVDVEDMASNVVFSTTTTVEMDKERDSTNNKEVPLVVLDD